MTLRSARPIRPAAAATVLAAAVAAALAATPASATELDARALALGGASITDGRGVNGVLANPASLAALKRSGARASFLLGGGVDARDHGDLHEIVTEDEAADLADDLDDEIDRLSGSTIDCNPLTDTGDAVCLDGTGRLGALSNDAIDLADRIDEEEVSGYGEARFGVAVTATPLAFAVHLGGRGSARGAADVTENDRAYAQDLADTLADGELTLAEIESRSREFAIENGALEITEPEDIVTSSGAGGAMYRVQTGVTFATGLAVGGGTLDVGVTPKVSRLNAWGTRAEFADAFDDDSPSIGDEFEDSETSEASFTFDAGVAKDLASVPVRLAAVVRNVVPESIETPDGIEFETTPQLLVGASHRRGRAAFSADVALNGARLDGIETQPIGVGVEYGTSRFALRGGVGADLGRSEDELALTLGAKLGPLELGGRLSGPAQGQFAAQISFGF